MRNSSVPELPVSKYLFFQMSENYTNQFCGSKPMALNTENFFVCKGKQCMKFSVSLISEGLY